MPRLTLYLILGLRIALAWWVLLVAIGALTQIAQVALTKALTTPPRGLGGRSPKPLTKRKPAGQGGVATSLSARQRHREKFEDRASGPLNGIGPPRLVR